MGNNALATFAPLLLYKDSEYDKHIYYMTTALRQQLIDRLIALDQSYTVLTTAPAGEVKKKREVLEAKQKKAKTNLVVFEVLAAVFVTLLLVFIMLHIFGIYERLDFNKGVLFILFTISNLVSAFLRYRHFVQLEKQTMLLALLEEVENCEER